MPTEQRKPPASMRLVAAATAAVASGLLSSWGCGGADVRAEQAQYLVGGLLIESDNGAVPAERVLPYLNVAESGAWPLGGPAYYNDGLARIDRVRLSFGDTADQPILSVGKKTSPSASM